MIFPSLRTMLATAMLSAGFLPQLTASAEEPGVVRISDGIQQTAGKEPASVPAPLPAEVAGDVDDQKNSISPIPEGAVIVDEYGHELHHHPNAIHDVNGKTWVPKAYASPLHVWFSQDPYAGTLPPNYGFYAPTSHPRVYRQPVVYRRYLPDQFYGTPGMKYSEVQYPMVHTPTDTTQLGYTYQHVPQWMPNRANYPLAPNPVLWQRRVDPMYPDHPRGVNGYMQNSGADIEDLQPVPVAKQSPSDSEI